MAYEDVIEAARRRMMPQRNGQSFFPGVNQRLFDDRSDLLRDTDAAFYGGGNAPPTPTPTPTPTPIPRSYFSGAYLNRTSPMNASTPLTLSPSINQAFPQKQVGFGFGMNRFNRPQYDFNNMQSLYGWSG